MPRHFTVSNSIIGNATQRSSSECSWEKLGSGFPTCDLRAPELEWQDLIWTRPHTLTDSFSSSSAFIFSLYLFSTLVYFLPLYRLIFRAVLGSDKIQQKVRISMPPTPAHVQALHYQHSHQVIHDHQWSYTDTSIHSESTSLHWGSLLHIVHSMDCFLLKNSFALYLVATTLADLGPHLCQVHWNHRPSYKVIMPRGDPILSPLGGPSWEMFAFCHFCPLSAASYHFGLWKL